MNKCLKCGNNKFFIHVDLLYIGDIDDVGQLVCFKDSETTETIACTNCGTTFDESDFKDIIYQ